jgi:hypothetical protein
MGNLLFYDFQYILHIQEHCPKDILVKDAFFCILGKIYLGQGFPLPTFS